MSTKVKTMKTRMLFPLSAILSFLLSTTVPGQTQAADKPSVIRIGVASVGTGGRPVIGGNFLATAANDGALEQEFAKDGIAVKYTYFAGAGPAVNEALANKQLDFAYQGDLPALVGKAGGLKTKLIAAAGRFSAIYIGVPQDSPAKSLEDLKGKRVALFKGTNLQLAFYNLLASRGLKDSDFKIINMSTFDGNAALLSKDIDAQVSGNDLFPLVDRGVVKVIHSTKSTPELTRLTHILVTEEFESQYPDLVQRLINVLLKTDAWEADESNRAKSYLIWTKSGLSLSAWRKEYDGESLAVRDSPLFDDYYRSQYKRLLKTAIELKLVRKSFDIDSWLEPKYLSKGLADLGLQGKWKPLATDGRVK
jgi:sulfonate transport system substrate-binding protein